KEHLLIPDRLGKHSLRVGEAVVIDNGVPDRDVARRLISESPWSGRLAHEKIENSATASKILADLGGSTIGDSEIVACLEEIFSKSEVPEAVTSDALLWIGEWHEKHPDAGGA